MAKKKKGIQPTAPLVSSLKLYLVIGSVTFLSIVLIIQKNLRSYDLDDIRDQEQANELTTNVELAKQPFDEHGFDLDPVIGDKPIWGSLNSGQYFGLKMSRPRSIEFGTMWFMNKLSNSATLDIRHLCDQNDRLASYGWTRHDFHSFGEQLISDGPYRLKTSYVINDHNSNEWRGLIEVEAPNQNSTKAIEPLSVILYLTVDESNDEIYIKQQESHTGRSTFAGSTSQVGDFELQVRTVTTAKILHESHITSKLNKVLYSLKDYVHYQLSPMRVDDKKIYILPTNKRLRPLDPGHVKKTNFAAYQIIVNAPVTIEFEFRQANAERVDDATDYKTELKSKIDRFEDKFDRLFDVDASLGSQAKSLARYALSNMLGSIGYFYGQSIIGTSRQADKAVPYGPIQLLTGVPSRSFFPRGFLWDEGFHNILISHWDANLSSSIIKSWFDIMNTNGWIPREVILGAESMRRVPNEFMVQQITNANPPSMFIVLEQMLDRGHLDERAFDRIYPRLKKWIEWFNLTQYGPKESTFRWRGREELSNSMLNPTTLTSGLDDYPRSTHPSPLDYHVDIRCWMALAARTMEKFARKRADVEYVNMISPVAKKLSDNQLLDSLHWDQTEAMYCDYGSHSSGVELVKMKKVVRKVYDGQEVREVVEVLERHSKQHPIFGCVPEFGYVSLFPMLLRIMEPDNQNLGHLLKRMRDEKQLWTQYGIRSLSKASRYYNRYNTEHDKPYWRGAIWLNMNYLILTSLRHYANLAGPFQNECDKIFQELRTNLVSNVLNEFSRTNYIWESYDDQSGYGKGSHPFTGWSSLILLIMSNKFD